MRGKETGQPSLYSYVSQEERIPADHPLRAIRRMVDAVLATLSRRFTALYSTTGRPSIPPEQLLRALLIQAFYSVRSERQLMEQLNYNLLFRWFVGLSMDDAVWDPTVFTKNRDRLLEGGVAQAFFDAVLTQARNNRLLSEEHFSVDRRAGHVLLDEVGLANIVIHEAVHEMRGAHIDKPHNLMSTQHTPRQMNNPVQRILPQTFQVITRFLSGGGQ